MCGRFTNKVTWREVHEQLSGFVKRRGWNAPVEDPKPRYIPFHHKKPLEEKKWSGINARPETGVCPCGWTDWD
jgi:hypothetical protein